MKNKAFQVFFEAVGVIELSRQEMCLTSGGVSKEVINSFYAILTIGICLVVAKNKFQRLAVTAETPIFIPETTTDHDFMVDHQNRHPYGAYYNHKSFLSWVEAGYNTYYSKPGYHLMFQEKEVKGKKSINIIGPIWQDRIKLVSGQITLPLGKNEMKADLIADKIKKSSSKQQVKTYFRTKQIIDYVADAQKRGRKVTKKSIAKFLFERTHRHAFTPLLSKNTCMTYQGPGYYVHLKADMMGSMFIEKVTFKTLPSESGKLEKEPVIHYGLNKNVGEPVTNSAEGWVAFFMKANKHLRYHGVHLGSKQLQKIEKIRARKNR